MILLKSQLFYSKFNQATKEHIYIKRKELDE